MKYPATHLLNVCCFGKYQDPHSRLRALVLRLVVVDRVMLVARLHSKTDMPLLRRDRRATIRAIAGTLRQIWGGSCPQPKDGSLRCCSCGASALEYVTRDGYHIRECTDPDCGWQKGEKL